MIFYKHILKYKLYRKKIIKDIQKCINNMIIKILENITNKVLCDRQTARQFY